MGWHQSGHCWYSVWTYGTRLRNQREHRGHEQKDWSVVAGDSAERWGAISSNCECESKGGYRLRSGLDSTCIYQECLSLSWLSLWNSVQEGKNLTAVTKLAPTPYRDEWTSKK